MFELKVRTEDGAVVDLVNEYELEKNDFSIKWVEDYIKLPSSNKVYTVETNTFNEETMKPLTATIKKSRWSSLRDVFAKRQPNNTLYIDYVDNGKTMTFEVKHRPEVEYTPLAATDEVELEITFVRLTNLYSKIVISSSASDENTIIPQESKYDLIYGKFKYAPEVSNIDVNYVVVNNDSDEVAPFRLVIEKGGVDIEWECIQNGDYLHKGKLYGSYDGEVVVDTDDFSIKFKGREVKQYKEHTYANFFNLPIGESMLNVKNVGKYYVEVYLQWVMPL